MKICDQLKKTFKIAMNKVFKKGEAVLVNVNAKQLAGRKVIVASAAKPYDGGQYVIVKDSAGELHNIDVTLLRRSFQSAAKPTSKKKAAPAKAATIISNTGKPKSTAKKTAPKNAAPKAGTVCVKLFNKQDTKDGVKAAKGLMKKNKKLTYREALSKTMSKEYPSLRK